MKKFLLLLATLLVSLVLLSPVVWATAGGYTGGHSGGTGGGHSGGSTGTNHYYSNNRGQQNGPMNALAGVVLFGALGYLNYRARRGKGHPVLKKQELYARVPGETTQEKAALLAELEENFLAIQKAWEAGNPRLAEHSYTPNLLAKHEAVLQEFQGQHLRNHTLKVKLRGYGYFQPLSADSLRVQFIFLAVDYVENMDSGVVVAGDARKKQEFWQTWYFNRSDGHWQADFVQEN
ncbi:hypothetical protein ACWOEH_06700 [Enterococcus nangangensis]